jgi:allantoin racemase
MRMLWINPIGTGVLDADLHKVLEAGKRAGTEVQVVSLPPDRPKHVDYHAYEALVVADVVRLTQQAADQYGAVVIGCFYDLGLREAREVSGRTVVTAPCQSATAIASHLGNTFSVLVGQRKNIPKMSENVRLYGHMHRMVSMRHLGLGVHEYQIDHERTCNILLNEGRIAVEEDGAEVVILGCAANFGFYLQMQDELGVPVIDAALAPLKYAELLAETAERFGWHPSRKWGSEAPPADELEEWGLFNEPAPVGVRTP